MTITQKTLMWATILCVVGVAFVIIGFVIRLNKLAQPVLLFDLPVEVCSTIPFGNSGLYFGLEVDSICYVRGHPVTVPHAQGFPYDSLPDHAYFAVKGMKVIRFVEDSFHSVYGKFILEPANTNAIYFYRHRGRYFRPGPEAIQVIKLYANRDE